MYNSFACEKLDRQTFCCDFSRRSTEWSDPKLDVARSLIVVHLWRKNGPLRAVHLSRHEWPTLTRHECVLGAFIAVVECRVEGGGRGL